MKIFIKEFTNDDLISYLRIGYCIEDKNKGVKIAHLRLTTYILKTNISERYVEKDYLIENVFPKLSDELEIKWWC